MLKIVEIFRSLQGESSFVGKQCIFVRLSGCNLRCNYCDTKNSWEEGDAVSIADIFLKIQKEHPTKLIEITGGEPLLQNQTIALMNFLLLENYNVLLETNGSISLKDVPASVIKIVDVKCPDSGSKDSFLIDNLKYLTPKDELKFVLSSINDYLFAKKFILENNIIANEILFSVVSSKISGSEIASRIIQDNIQVRMQLQLHKILKID